MFFNLPNIISFSRVVIAPLFILLMLSESSGYIVLGTFLFLLASISDYIDGWYARKYNLVTKWGKFFDPLADKILTTSAFIVFVYFEIMPLWMVLIIIVRDFGTTIIRILMFFFKKQMKTSILAKWKTAIQMIFISSVLCLIFVKYTEIFELNPLIVHRLIYSDITYYFAFLLTIFTLWTLLDYIFQNKSLFKSIWSSFTKKKLANE